MAKLRFEVYGIDISPKGIEITKEWLKREKLKAKLEIGDIYKKLPYENNFFDAIISTRTLHHNKLEKIRKLIKEIKRILKPKGLIFITVRKAFGVKGWRKGKIVIHKYKINRKIKRTRYKVIGPRICTPIEGGEKGLIHFCFNKKLIKKEFRNFKIPKIWTTGGEYCFLGELKSKMLKI